MTLASKCVFCEIIKGSAPSRVLLENDTCISFLDIAPASRGHSLIVPKVHFKDIFDISSELLLDVMKMTKQVSELLFAQLNPDGLSIFQMNKSAGWQTIFHFHMHAVPRWQNDQLIEPWVEKRAQDHELEEIHKLFVKPK